MAMGTNRWADWLLEDLEARRSSQQRVADTFAGRGEYRAQSLCLAGRDAYSAAIAYVRDALPRIIEEAQRVEPDRAAVFAPLPGGDPPKGYEEPFLPCDDCTGEAWERQPAVVGQPYCEDHLAARAALADMAVRTEMLP